jgi:hypothetical protein
MFVKENFRTSFFNLSSLFQASRLMQAVKHGKALETGVEEQTLPGMVVGRLGGITCGRLPNMLLLPLC